MKKGEALCLSCSKAASLISRGLIVDAHIGLDLLDKYETRAKVLMEKLGYSQGGAQTEAVQLVNSCLKRHESMKSTRSPGAEFLAKVEEFNRNATGKNPITKVDAETGVGEWAGYRCNIGHGCSHGCLYCYAEKMATRFKRVDGAEEWREEVLQDLSTEGCKKYDSAIMFPTSHDITPNYLDAYQCHLYNILSSGNRVVLVSKPHRESIEAICAEFSSFRDVLTFRFTIGGIDTTAMRHWEPGAPALAERLDCLKHAFEAGYRTSVSAEPMLGGSEEAEKLYYMLEPYATEDLWFGKMNMVGGLRKNQDPEIVRYATELYNLQTDEEIMELVEKLDGLSKVQWKDSVKEIIEKAAQSSGTEK
ncbi:hypothetical protein [Geobacter sp. AOG1]|uniref:hypothetical protein n=1 Tax=Geobacter sp. AOG1 TaxID=1566346 RepID=UPI001CC416C7|nr:hypothetical protein [Geobacter sp. AOG1]